MDLDLTAGPAEGEAPFGWPGHPDEGEDPYPVRPADAELVPRPGVA